jgi:serum/glucocorticoid-regulated kinase 2
LGALLYELLTGLPPYYSRDTDKIYKNILTKDLTFPQGICSAEAKDLIS